VLGDQIHNPPSSPAGSIVRKYANANGIEAVRLPWLTCPGSVRITRPPPPPAAAAAAVAATLYPSSTNDDDDEGFKVCPEQTGTN
jgi:hypothetical protein